MAAYYLIILLTILWIPRTVKNILFFLYLWQLKEYHIRRFIDHFRTDKGKSIFLNYIFFAKIFLAIFSIFLLPSLRYLGRAPFLTTIAVIAYALYFFETIFFIKNIFQKNFKKPVFTKKALILLFSALLITSIFFAAAVSMQKEIFYFVFWLLIFDIFTLFIVSLIVLIFQPFVVLYRNEFIIKKAREKILSRKDLIVVGITGSYGKTSVKELLSILLSSKFNVLKTDKHQNSEMGISQCILNNLKPEHQVFVVEMGSYGVGGIKLLAGIAMPKIGILTGINEQHLSLYKSQANIISTKYELIKSLPKDGLAIFNGDNKYCLELFRGTEISKKIYSTKNIVEEIIFKPDIWAEDIKIEKEYVYFKACAKKGESVEIKANILGEQNIPNILGAIIAANEMGVSFEEIKNACSKITQEQGSIILKKGKRGINILDASYSSNPDGALADLEFLKIWHGKKIVIIPCLIELGKASKEIHKKIGKKIGESCDLAIITSSERFDEIKEGALLAGMKQENIILIENPEEILIQLDIFSNKGDTILLEGRVFKKLINSLIN